MKALIQTQQAILPQTSSWFLSALSISWRFGVSALVLIVWSWSSLRCLTRLEIEEGFGLGIFGAAGILLQMDGLIYTEASTSAFLTQCYAIIIPLWLGLLNRKWPSWTTALSCALVMTGVAVLSGLSFTRIHLGRGELETIIAALFFTGQILWLDRPKYANTNTNRFSIIMFATIALAVLPVAWATNLQSDDWIKAFTPPATWGFLLLLVVFCTLGGYMLMNYWQKHVSATQAGLIYCLEPLFASIFAMILPALYSQAASINYLNERLTMNLLIGGGLITIANLLLQWTYRGARLEPQDLLIDK